MEVPAWKSSLMKYRSKLRSVCHVGKFLPDLRQLLTATEYSCVQNKPDDVSRVDELVRILLTKDERDFEVFCSVLERNGYPRWAKLLNPKVTEASALGDDSLKRHYSSPGKMISTTVRDAKPEIHTAEVSTEKIAGGDWSFSAIWSYLIKVAKGTSHFGVLVVGETGTGKSSLINNLVGKDVVKVGDSMESETSKITELRLTVEGVPFILVDTPGLSDSRVGDEENLERLKDILGRGKIHLVIYCMKFSETRMRGSLIKTFQEYHRIGLKWEQTVIALTFADGLSIPKQKKNDPIARYFNERLVEMRAHIACVLVERVGVVPDVAKNVKCYPTTDDYNRNLLNGEEWYVPLWLDILNMQSPGAAARFLAMHAKNIEFRSTEEATSGSAFPPKAPHGNHSSVPIVQAEGVAPSPGAGTVAGGTFAECSKQDSSDQPNTQQNNSPTPVPQVGKSDDIHAKARPIVLDPNYQRGFLEILSKKFGRIPNFFRSLFSSKSEKNS